MARKRNPATGSAREPKLVAPNTDYPDGEGNVLTLRGSLTPATRARYAQVRAGSPLSQEDAWHRAVEFLFEHLAVRWTIHDVAIERQRDLLARLRAASQAERTFVRDSLRAHCAESFPDVKAP